MYTAGKNCKLDQWQSGKTRKHGHFRILKEPFVIERLIFLSIIKI
jgi:hypothetical protein